MKYEIYREVKNDLTFLFFKSWFYMKQIGKYFSAVLVVVTFVLSINNDAKQ